MVSSRSSKLRSFIDLMADTAFLPCESMTCEFHAILDVEINGSDAVFAGEHVTQLPDGGADSLAQLDPLAAEGRENGC